MTLTVERLTQMERLLSAMGKGSKMPSDGLGLYLGDGLPRPGLGELRTNELLELVREVLVARNGANALAAVTLERMAHEAPISGNDLAHARVMLAAQQLRGQTTWTLDDWRENYEYVGFIDHS